MGLLNKLFGANTKPIHRWFGHPNVPDFDSINNFGQIPRIFEWVFNEDITVATKCAGAIDRQLNKEVSFQNKTLYLSFRYVHLKKDHLKVFNKFEEKLKLSLLCIASMNSNGYVREEALNGLLANPNQFTFPFILFRLSDWVSAIRLKAESAIQVIIQNEEPEFLIKNHKLIDWLLRIERSDLQHIHNHIIQSIFSDRNTESIIKSIYKYSDGEKFFIFKNLITRGKLECALDEILSDKNNLIRLLAVRNIDFIDNIQVAKKLLNDRSQKIKQYTINRIPNNKVNELKDEIYQLIFDTSSGVRASARLLLTKHGNYNFREIYREALEIKPNSGCILGLAEVGSKSDTIMIEGFLKSKVVKLRASSLLALSILDYGYSKELSFQLLLNDNSNTVKRICSIIIQRETSTDDLEKLRTIYDIGQNETKRFILKTISHYGGWSIVGDFLKGILESDTNLRQMSYSLLNGWYLYSVRLGTTQKHEEKHYVMDIFKKGQFDKRELPQGIERIVKEIPFIFS